MKKLNGKTLLVISLIICLYFLALFSIYYFKMDHFLIGFFSELLTIPFFLAQIIFLAWGIKMIFSTTPQQNLIIISVLILAITTILTIGSFFWK